MPRTLVTAENPQIAGMIDEIEHCRPAQIEQLCILEIRMD
jgi:hypothetical protein